MFDRLLNFLYKIKKKHNKLEIPANTQSYKLLKDLPNLKTGAVLYYHPDSNFYIHVKKNGHVVGYPRDVVEVYPAWFKSITDSEGSAWWNKNI